LYLLLSLHFIRTQSSSMFFLTVFIELFTICDFVTIWKCWSSRCCTEMSSLLMMDWMLSL
jgi:hypothetical protein